MTRKVLTASAASALALAFFLSGGLKDAGGADLTDARGGDDCYFCKAEPSACKDEDQPVGISLPCAQRPPGSGIYTQWIGTDITQKFCSNVIGGQLGTTECKTRSPQICVYTWTCTDADCENCGDPGTETKPTDCEQKGYECRT